MSKESVTLSMKLGECFCLMWGKNSLVRFIKNNIFSYPVKDMPGKMRKKDKNSKDCPSDAKISRHVTSNYMGERWENETAIS